MSPLQMNDDPWIEFDTAVDFEIWAMADMVHDQIRVHARAARAHIQAAHLRHVAELVRGIESRRELAALLRRARMCNTTAGEPPCVS